MMSSYRFDKNRICDRLRYALLENEISYQRAAREIGVSRDVLFDYTSPDYPEESMQMQTLIKNLRSIWEKTGIISVMNIISSLIL